MQHDERRIDSGLERSQDLTATGDVESESFLHHDPLDGCARERLGGEYHPRVGPPACQFSCILACAISERFLGDHEHRCPELGGEIVDATTTDDQHAVGIGGAAWREEVQQLAHASMVDRSA